MDSHSSDYPKKQRCVRTKAAANLERDIFCVSCFCLLPPRSCSACQLGRCCHWVLSSSHSNLVENTAWKWFAVLAPLPPHLCPGAIIWKSAPGYCNYRNKHWVGKLKGTLGPIWLPHWDPGQSSYLSLGK